MSAARRAVVGAGAWGTTLAWMLARSGPVTLLARDAGHAARMVEKRENERYLPGIPLPVEIEIVADPFWLADAADLVVLAVPSAAMRSVARGLAEHVTRHAVVLSVAKGIERGSLKRMTQVVADEVPDAATRVAALSGPNLALEIARGLPASSVVGQPTRPSVGASSGSWVPGRSVSIGIGTSSAWSCAARSRTSWPSPPARPTGWASATTARPG